MDDVTNVLDAMRIDAERLFGSRAASFRPVAVFDRLYSTVIRLRVLVPDRAPAFVFVKIYKDRPPLPYETPASPADVVREEFAATRRVHEALAGRPGLSSPRPIASFPEHGAIVTQELLGTPLDRVLRIRRGGRHVPTLEAIATRIGVWLRAYQRCSKPDGSWSIEEGRAYLDERLRHVARVLGAPARAGALAAFDRLAAEVEATEPLVPIHADLCPANIMVTPGGGVAVIDLATAQTGTRYHDIAHLYLHLELAGRRLGWRAIDVRPVQASLLAAFDCAGVARHPLFRLMLLQHVVCHVTQVADGAGRAPRLALAALARWRWRVCLAMPVLTGSVLPAVL